MLVTSGATVEEIWDYKVDGKSLDNMLAICGQYVDFAPKYSPHFVCPAIVQQHRNFNFSPVSLSFLWQVKYEETKKSVELVSLSFFPHRQWWDEKISSSWRNDNRPKTDCFLLKKISLHRDEHHQMPQNQQWRLVNNKMCRIKPAGFLISCV